MKIVTAAAAAAACALALAGPAEAKPKPVTYKLNITGEQLTTWDYVKKQAPSCDWPEQGAGRQYIEFHTATKGYGSNPKVRVSPGAGGKLEIEALKPETFWALAEADLKRSFAIRYSQMSDCPPGGGPFGGGDPPADEVGEKECQAEGGVMLRLGGSLEDVVSESYPDEVAAPKGGGIFFRADPFWDIAGTSYPSLPALCDFHAQGQADIGIGVSRGEWAGGLITGATKLPAKKLLAKNGKKKITAEVNSTVKYPNALQPEPGPAETTTGKTTMDAKIVFTRVKG